MAEYLEIDPYNPEHKLIRKVVHMLRQGAVIAYPTDTVYGIGCDLHSKESIDRIYRIKKMPKHKPLSLLCADLSDIASYAHVGNASYKLMKRLIPGPYTFILPVTRMVPRTLLPKRRTLGIRVPDNQVVQAIIKELANPLINTSASLDQKEILSDPAEIERTFGDQLDLIIDGGVLPNELSTVVDLTAPEPEIVREGKGDVSLIL
ncbi:MAG: L-threonylcarbamoyladenylate synthase [Chloroflexi bacterium]|nr:L-threonylcarbamoyladenylate synthase [Chloroflexota bacterium]